MRLVYKLIQFIY